jgi:hypothetical protein
MLVSSAKSSDFVASKLKAIGVCVATSWSAVIFMAHFVILTLIFVPRFLTGHQTASLNIFHALGAVRLFYILTE